jgi:hypothetical protein
MPSLVRILWSSFYTEYCEPRQTAIMLLSQYSAHPLDHLPLATTRCYHDC